jgi:hypothetical protein
MHPDGKHSFYGHNFYAHDAQSRRHERFAWGPVPAHPLDRFGVPGMGARRAATPRRLGHHPRLFVHTRQLSRTFNAAVDTSGIGGVTFFQLMG